MSRREAQSAPLSLLGVGKFNVGVSYAPKIENVDDEMLMLMEGLMEGSMNFYEAGPKLEWGADKPISIFV
jgi:hypothetical protein